MRRQVYCRGKGMTERAIGEARLTDRIILAEYKAKTVDLVFVKRVRVQDPDVHVPLLQIICTNERYAGRKALLYLSCCSAFVIQDFLPTY